MNGALLIAGVTLAAATEALTGTLLALGRSDLMGDRLLTPDEFALLDTGYITLKILGFGLAPCLLGRLRPELAVMLALTFMATTCGAAVFAPDPRVLGLLRAAQGFGGGVVLVGAQAILFWSFARGKQALIQALFAIGSVVFPAAVAPAVQGWLIDVHSWHWVMAATVLMSLLSIGLILLSDRPIHAPVARVTFDLGGAALLLAATLPATFVLRQGNRWLWFESSLVIWGTVLAIGAAVAFLRFQRMLPNDVFGSAQFPFAFCVSFVAGAALFGSAFVIPNFNLNALGTTPAAAGAMLLPSAPVFVLALLGAAFITQRLGVPISVFVPIGIGCVMAALWMLAGSALHSGPQDMTGALMLRGFGLGTMFLALTLMAFGGLPATQMAAGIAIFNIGRQLGGLIGVAGLQTLLDHQVAGNYAILSSGIEAVPERVSATAAKLEAAGLDPVEALATANRLLAQSITGQSSIIAFQTAFGVLALMFVAAVPYLIAMKILLGRLNRRVRCKPPHHVRCRNPSS